MGETRNRIRSLQMRRAELEAAIPGAPKPLVFGRGLKGAMVSVIAEVKRRSPSKGDINRAIDAPTQAAAYADGGAAAISVLTEPLHFSGSPDDLVAVRQRVGVPVLKKDFHLHPIQLLEARALGASAALLIVRALEPTLLLEMMSEASALGLETLVEVHTEAELDRALKAGAQVIGVNSRDLETLEIDAAVAEALVPMIPAKLVAIWESGVSGPLDVTRAASFGADAVLVGSAVSGADDPAAAVRALTQVKREAARL